MTRWSKRDLNILRENPNDLPWDDLRIAANAVGLAGAQAASFEAFHTDFAALAFSSSSDNYCYFDIQMPHRWYEGDAIEFHLHWSTEIAGNNDVCWVLKHSWSNINDVFPSATTVTKTVDISSEPAHKHMITELIYRLDAGGKRASSVMLMSLMRDVSEDSFSGKAFLISADAHYRSSDDGSYHEFHKLRDYKDDKGSPTLKFKPGAW